MVKCSLKLRNRFEMISCCHLSSPRRRLPLRIHHLKPEICILLQGKAGDKFHVTVGACVALHDLMYSFILFTDTLQYYSYNCISGTAFPTRDIFFRHLVSVSTKKKHSFLTRVVCGLSRDLAYRSFLGFRQDVRRFPRVGFSVTVSTLILEAVSFICEFVASALR